MSMINVNQKPCECANHKSFGLRHWEHCPGIPVLIPLPIHRSFTCTVVLGECWGVGPGRCVSEDSARRFKWATRHSERCPAHPIRVSCSISGETWKDSEMKDVETRDETWHPSAPRYYRALSAARDLWALLKALVTGKHGDAVKAVRASPTIPWSALGPLLQQRDAVFAAICKMARAEEAAALAQQQALKALGWSWIDYGGCSGHQLDMDGRRPCVVLLGRYVEHLIGQVGILGVAQ